MATLYKRATPRQRELLRIIEGAVFNTADAHGQKRDMKLARSIAKRAAGTLSSRWERVLAAEHSPPSRGERATKAAHSLGRSLTCPKGREPTIGNNGGIATARYGKTRRMSSHKSRRHPLQILIARISKNMRLVRATGDKSKIDAYIDILRMIDDLKRKLAENEQ